MTVQSVIYETISLNFYKWKNNNVLLLTAIIGYEVKLPMHTPKHWNLIHFIIPL